MESRTVKLNATHNKRSMRAMEIRFETNQTIAAVKVMPMQNNLEYRFGTSADFMLLKLFDDGGNVVATMNDNDAALGTYNPQDFYTIHIIDMDPSTVNIDNLEDVPKYEISEEDYAQRDNTFRKFKEEKMKSNPDLFKSNKPEFTDDFMEEFARDIEVGMRCSVTPGDKRGTVRYVGKVPEAQPGFFVGVELDEPLGKNDGSVKGVRYFECQPNFGLFVRPNILEVGNYPPISEEDPDEI